MKQKPVVIITGAANGIGRAIALRFASVGFALAIADVDAGGLEKVKKETASPDVLCLAGDLQEPDFVDSIAKTTVDRFGRIDVLINNAAWRTIETMRNISRANWEKAISINLTAPAFLAQHTAAVMERMKISGVIINVSSVMSGRAGGNSPAYIVSKGGIESLTYELAVLYGPKGIRVVAVNPGNIETNLSKDFKNESGDNISSVLVDHMIDHTPLKRGGTPEEIAGVCYWLSTKDASFITGTSILVDGGFLHNFNSYQMKKLQYPNEF